MPDRKQQKAVKYDINQRKNICSAVSHREVDLTHIGFLWGKNANRLVYQPILQMLRKMGDLRFSRKADPKRA
jgi:hypothetical protein